MKGFIFQQRNPKVGLVTSTEETQRVTIDLGDSEISKSTGVSVSTTPPKTSVPNTLPTTSPSREPLEIIQSIRTSSLDDENIFSRLL